MNLKKRKWIYCQQPSVYEIRCNLCNGINITWSEFEGHIYCFDCKKDVKGFSGIFDSPIPLEVAQMFGISFDRIDLKTKERLYMRLTKKGDRFIWRKKKLESRETR
jgi:hypothetical protein